MTVGSAHGHLWRYALPLLIGNALLCCVATALGVAFACGWSLMLLFEIPYYFHTCRKRGLTS